ncbi:MAG: E2 ligase fold family C protein [bacterium]|nr:E2 ligase fold family C protein [bacterium]MDE0602424.1 E2 ligase fold family C protein [bacterium]
MGLADFFPRDAIAISQILQGFQTDAFIKKLQDVRVAISFGEQAVNSRDGRDLIDLSVRLAARLYPTITFATIPVGNRLADEMSQLARSINPRIEVSKNGTADVVLAIGLNAPQVEASTVYAGCDNWVARVGTKRPYSTSDFGNPFGAGFAACLAAANLFRFLFIPDGAASLDADTSFPSEINSFPSLARVTLTDPLVLVGAGAVGNCVAWALARTPVLGQLWLVDPEVVELSNLQRYVLCNRSDEHGSKVEIVGRFFQGGMETLHYQGTWASFLGAHGYKWERVLVALDSARDRRAVQASLPRWVANAWTQLGDLGVSSHSFLGSDACLACLYLPTQKSKSQDQIVAEGLRIPQFQNQVRVLLGSGQKTGKEICDAVAGAWGVSAEALGTYAERPIRDLWVEGVCGGGIIPLGTGGPTPTELQVPLAFQSALAGMLLAAVTLCDVLNAGKQRKTLVRRLDVLRPLGDTSQRPALKAGNGRCICEDPDFVAAYRAKY